MISYIDAIGLLVMILIGVIGWIQLRKTWR